LKTSDFVDSVLALPRAAKRLIVLSVDAAICVVSVLLAFYLRIGEWVSIEGPPVLPILASIALALPIFVSFGLYRTIFRYSGGAALLMIGKAVTIYAVPFALLFTLGAIPGVPRTIGLIQPILLFLLVAGSRTVASAFLGETYQALWRRGQVPRVLIYGAGSAGRQLASAMRSSSEMQLVGFVDDDPALANSTMNGVTIHGPQALRDLVVRAEVTEILLAVPSANRARRTEIVRDLKEYGLHVRTLPGLMDIARGKISIADLKELEIEDLLGRASVPPDPALLARDIAGKTVLVTGAGGSIGSELCRQIAAIGPKTLLLVDNSEFMLYSLHQELGGSSQHDFTLVPLLASVCDAARMEEIISVWRPESIFHAAAYKHVPLVEHNPVEGVRNNVIGTLTMARLARDHQVTSFVLISTDKAVRPTNVMGTSKRLAEMILQALHAEGGTTRFSMVRFGNVLGSNGSVVPLFRGQIAAGGPVTITHLDIIRYFMTIPEAAQLVLQAGAMAQGGEVFVLDMGEPVRISDMARNMIELSGLTVRDADNPDGDIEIEVVGLRPGEKLYEELLIGADSEETSHPRILMANERFAAWPVLNASLDTLRSALDRGDARSTCAILKDIVPEYNATEELFDLVALARERAAR